MKFSATARGGVILPLLLLFGFLSSPSAEMASKRYRFAKNKLLPLQLTAGDLEVRSVLFEFPSAVMGFRGSNRAKVKVINRGSEPRRVGIAIALFDAQDRLVGVSSGGTKGLRLKPGQETDYSLPFQVLDEQVENAASFFITIESS